MKIGLFGDSYVDTIWHRNPGHTPAPGQIPWPGTLLAELNSPVISSGLGGTNQFHAIEQWRQHSATTQFDYAIFTFTWDNRLYSSRTGSQQVLSASAELRELTNIEKSTRQPHLNIDALNMAIDLYYKHVHNNAQSIFLFDLMVKWCLELPKQFPNTKFIFIPNTEVSRTISQRHFTEGVLLDFAFETLSNRETGSPGLMPIDCGRFGHLNSGNHIRFKDMMKNIILNYNQYQNQLYPVDYNDFDIVK